MDHFRHLIRTSCAATTIASAVLALAACSTDAATAAVDATARRNDELQAQLVALQAKKTDRGMALTLGEVLFSTGRADLKAGSVANPGRLLSFLDKAPDRAVRIEGYTENTGGQSLNEALSQKRADSVATCLTGRGISGSRVTAWVESYSSPVPPITPRRADRPIVALKS